MPYKIVESDGMFCVHKETADKLAGAKMHCYDNKADAEKYMRALYANVKTSALVEQSMCITKASFDKSTGTQRFRMVASDTAPDVYDERMSLELFNDFTSRIEKASEVPAPFKSILSEKSGWSGGVPYVSLAHYKSGIEGRNIPADTEKVYIDGEMLKATAVCRDTPLGKAVFKALKDDLEGKSEYEDKVRVSIGFLDLSHSHGDYVFTRDTLDKVCPMCENEVGNKVYLKGQLVHLALTRAPVNPRTDTEVDMGKQITTKREDAESIVGESLADEVEVNKSALDAEPEILVVKADTEVESVDNKPIKSDAVETVPEPVVVTDPVAVVEPAEKSVLDIVMDEFKAKVMSVKSMSRDEALKALQGDFELVAKAVQNEFPEPPAPVVASIDPAFAELLTSVKSAMDALVGQVGSLSTEVAILKSQGVVVNQQLKQQEVATPRNLQIERSVIPQLMDIHGVKPLSIAELARKSVYTN